MWLVILNDFYVLGTTQYIIITVAMLTVHIWWNIKQVIFYSRLVCGCVCLVEWSCGASIAATNGSEGKEMFFLGPINIFLCSSHRETILLRNQDGSLSRYRLVGDGPLSESCYGDRDVKIEMNIYI